MKERKKEKIIDNKQVKLPDKKVLKECQVLRRMEDRLFIPVWTATIKK